MFRWIWCTAVLVLMCNMAAARVPTSSPDRPFPKLDSVTTRNVLAASAATWSIRRLACSTVAQRQSPSTVSNNMLPATVSYANAEISYSRIVAYKVALKKDLRRLATVPPVASLPSRQEVASISPAALTIEEEWEDAMLSCGDEEIYEPTAMISGDRAAWIADEVFSDRFGSCSFRVVTRPISGIRGTFGMATRGDRARRFFSGFGSGLGSSSTALSSRSGGSDHDSNSNVASSGGSAVSNTLTLPKWQNYWNRGNRRHKGARNVEVICVEVRLQGFGTAQTTRACLDALSNCLDQCQPLEASKTPLRLPGLPLSQRASSPSSVSSSSSQRTFPVYIDMIESSAASPRTIPLVVGFLRHVGSRFDKVSLVGTGPSMGTARAIIAIASLQKFRVFPNFRELQRAVAAKKW